MSQGDGLVWRGENQHLHTALYVFLIAPASWLPDGMAAYTAAKLGGVVMLSLTAIPVWLLARSLVRPGLALAAAALTLAGTWMILGAGILTETAALPLATASMTAGVMAVRRPSGPFIWVAVGFAVLATAARVQTGILFPTLLAALLIDVARAGSGWCARARLHRTAIGVLLAVVAMAVTAVAANRTGSLGTYSSAVAIRPSFADGWRQSGLQLLGLLAMTGFIPVLLAAGASLRRATWRDEATGPLLCVLWPCVLAFSLQSGFYIAGIDISWTIERYVAYPAPLTLLFAVVVLTRQHLLNRAVVAIAAVAGLLLLAMPDLSQAGEQHAIVGIALRADDIGHLNIGAACVGIAALLGTVIATASWRLRRRAAPVDLATIGVAVLAVWLVAQSATAWKTELTSTHRIREDLPNDQAWVDHHADGPVAVLMSMTVAPTFWQLELQNQRISDAFVERHSLAGPPLRARTCLWHPDPNGFLVAARGCETRRWYLVNDVLLHATFDGERQRFDDPHAGRLVEVSGRPRFRSLVLTSCPRPFVRFADSIGNLVSADAPQSCTGKIDVRLWSGTPGMLRVIFDGAPVDPHAAMADGRQRAIPPARRTTLQIPTRAGASHMTVALDWGEDSLTAPKLVDVQLSEHGRSRSLL